MRLERADGRRQDVFGRQFFFGAGFLGAGLAVLSAQTVLAPCYSFEFTEGMSHRCLLGFGSNVGDRAATIRSGIGMLEQTLGNRVTKASEFYETKAVGGPLDQLPYLNACCILETSLTPELLLKVTQGVETALGRVRQERWGPRTLDIDLLLFDELEFRSESLEIPHPRFAVRRFMLEPAAEVAPAWRYPVNGWPIERLLSHLSHASRRVALYALNADWLAKIRREAERRNTAVWQFHLLENPSPPPTGTRFAFVLAPESEATSPTHEGASLHQLFHRPDACPAVWCRQIDPEQATNELVAACETSE